MTSVDDRADAALIRELEPAVAGELTRHLDVAKEWFPHQYVPWSEGSDFEGEYDGTAWDSEQSRIDAVGRTALVVNLLTEDNLPSYHRAIADVTGRHSAWGEWLHRWTAEEARHGTAMRDYLTVTRAVDPIALERERMDHMSRGFASDNEQGVLMTMSYVSFQELATRISHRNTGRHVDDPGLDRLLARIAADENLHMLFYRNVMNAAFDAAPDESMVWSTSRGATYMPWLAITLMAAASWIDVDASPCPYARVYCSTPCQSFQSFSRPRDSPGKSRGVFSPRPKARR